jgi:hypothetical protein
MSVCSFPSVSKDFASASGEAMRHTPDFGLWYTAFSSLVLHGFSDADFAVSVG